MGLERTMQSRMKWMAAAAAVVLGSAGAWWAWQSGALTGGQGAAAEGAGASGPMGWNMQGTDSASTEASGAGQSALTPEQVRIRLFKEGSLADTQPFGDWCVSPEKALKPCRGLRTRFEYYILGIGEVSIADIRGLIEDESRRAHGDKLTTEIMALFDRYWQIRTYDWKHHFVQSDRATWLPVFEEQRSVRRQILGQPWAEAFFSDDEKQFKDYYAQLESGQPPPPDPGEPVPQMEPGKDPAAVHAERAKRYGEDAAQRLADVDAQWAEWDKRLAAARSEWERIQALPNLSDVQKQDEMQRYVEANFQDKDRLRIRALLKLR
jgi:lipase chaperone LimK